MQKNGKDSLTFSRLKYYILQTPYPKAKYSISIVSDKKVETNYALPKYLIELLIPNPTNNYLYILFYFSQTDYRNNSPVLCIT